jgi:hypothetical protein
MTLGLNEYHISNAQCSPRSTGYHTKKHDAVLDRLEEDMRVPLTQ